MRTIAKADAVGPSTLPEILGSPARLHWSIQHITAQDAHQLDVGFTCSMVRVNQPAERRLFDEVFAAVAAVSQAAIVNHFLPALRAAASDLAATASAESLLVPSARPRWIQALQQAANEIGFMCGLAALAPFEVQVTSPTVQRQRLEQMQRIAVERRSADQIGHLARAADLLKQWETLKADVPSITPGKLLEQLNPADRGSMLETLLMAGSQSGESQPDLWAVSGSQLLRIDLKTDSPQAQAIPTAPAAGPLRSVRRDNGQLLIGARSGIVLLDPQAPDQPMVYCHSALLSDHGFTSVTVIGREIWACHRAGGMVGWELGKTDAPARIITPAQLGGEPKNLTSAGLFSVAGDLLNLGREKPLMRFDSSIVALLPMAGQVLVVCQDGLLTSLGASTLEKVNETQTAGRISGAAMLPWLSSVRVLLNRTEGPVECVGLEDQLVTQFNAGSTGTRAVTACAGKVAAMSSDRQRVLFWNAWNGRKIAGELYLSGITRHRVADIAFG